MEKEYYVEFLRDSTEPDYDYIWAVSPQDVENIIASVYGDVEITLIEEYYDDMTDILRGIAHD